MYRSTEKNATVKRDVIVPKRGCFYLPEQEGIYPAILVGHLMGKRPTPSMKPGSFLQQKDMWS
ncbi:hypothetical protein [Pseudalkalibacillus caeni]|uniref:hypothetical protein n=1 Tax=Exobacillus caeni TaxID=2574798 RepID=UPI001FEC178B|nr:hypothetical protein [Pseudalkalibacillus caeni]